MGTSVIIADDHRLFRAGLRAVLDPHEGIQVVGEASTGRQAVDLCSKTAPDIAILDIDMPEMNGLIAARAIMKVCEDTKILILSMLYEEETILEAIRSGVHGYVVKDSAVEELLSAIDTVMSGETYLSPTIATVVVRRLAQEKGKEKESPLDLLSDREKEVLQMLVEGRSTSEVAEALFISQKTVENHRGNIMNKLDVHDMPSLVKFAIRTGLTHP